MPTLAQIYIDKGEAKGKVGTILTILSDRFGEVPQTIHNTVTKIYDLAVLDQLALFAGKCKSLAEFANALK